MRTRSFQFLLTAGLWAASAAAVSAAGDQPEPLHFLQVEAIDKAAYVRLYQMGLDMPEALSGPQVTVIGTDAEKAWLEGLGYSVEYKLPHATRHFATRARAAGAATMGGFRTLAEGIAAIDSLIADYPDVVSEKLTIGLTGELRPIYAIRISDQPNVDEAEPAVLFSGLHHAREPMSAHINIHTMQQLAWGYGTDSALTALINEREIWFIPFLNPDGYFFNEQIAPNGGGLWRKNRVHNGDGSMGVDPNRNYGYRWGLDDAGSSPDPFDDTYRGPFAFSEQETQAMRDFCMARPNIRIAFNYHSYSNLLLYPPGYETGFTPDQVLFAAIADSATTWNNYLPVPGWALYLTNGDSDDWMYFTENILALTPEVGSGADYFWPDPGRIGPLTDENHPANLFVIAIADAPERLLPPLAPVWDSIVHTGTDSLALYWRNVDSSVNAPVQYHVQELFGAHRIMDDFESGDSLWHLDRFALSFDQVYAGTFSLYSGSGDNYAATALMGQPLLVEPGDTLRFWTNYSTEAQWDYAYVEVSTDGGSFYTSIPGNITTIDDPNGNNDGFGITGSSGGWTIAWFDLSDYAGLEVQLRLAYRTDGFVHGFGIYVDNISPVQSFDSAVAVATAAAPPLFLSEHPEGAYYFRVAGEDPQGQSAQSLTQYYSYSSGPGYLLGDADFSGFITAADIVYLVNYVYKAGPEPLPEVLAGDADGTGYISAADIIYLVNYVYKAGPPPGG